MTLMHQCRIDRFVCPPKRAKKPPPHSGQLPRTVTHQLGVGQILFQRNRGTDPEQGSTVWAGLSTKSPRTYPNPYTSDSVSALLSTEPFLPGRKRRDSKWLAIMLY
jgi:hypothetical protein